MLSTALCVLPSAAWIIARHVNGKMSTGWLFIDAGEQPGSAVSLSCHGVNPGDGANDAYLGFGAKYPGKTEVLQGRGVLAKNCEGPGRRGVQVPAMRVQLKAFFARRD